MGGEAGKDTQVHVFGSYRLDIGNERLWRGKVRVSLRPKAFSLLCCLVKQPGELLTRETLIVELWPKIHVSDGVLTEYVREIRKVLRDDAKRPRYIETVHRRGYRFIGSVSVSSDPRPARSFGASHLPIAADTAAVAKVTSIVGTSPLVGRQRELSVLQERLNAALDGNGNVLFITGQAGIGKTRLARELQVYARQRGCQWLEGKHEQSASQPYKAWTEVVRSYLRQNESIPLQGLEGRHVVHLAKIVPEVAEGLNDGSTTIREDPESERLRLFEGLSQFFIEVSREAPLVLFLDDLQWASSIELLYYLSQRVADQRMLVVAAYRDNELKENTSLWTTVLAMNRERIFRSLLVEYLQLGEVAQLVSQSIGGPADTQLIEIICQKTKGNPFFVEEMSHFFQERKAIVQTETGWKLKESAAQQTPESIKAVINDQAARLGDAAENLLRIASVAGREFSLTLLQELVDQGDEALIDVIDRCEKAGLVVSQQVPGEEMYSFVHDLIQKTLYDSIGSARRRRDHLRIGEAIEQRYPHSLYDHYDALAQHFLEGNDLEKALKYSLKAGERAGESSSWELADEHFKTALQLLKRFPENLIREVQILEQITSFETLLGRPGLIYAERTLELYTRLGDERKAARVHHLFAVGWTSGTAGEVDFDKAQHHRETGVKLLEAHPDSVEKASVHWELSYGFYYALDLEQGVHQGQTALEIARRLGNPDAVAEAAQGVMFSLMALGQLAKGEEYAEQAWEACLQGSDPWVTARTAIVPIMLAPWRHEKLWLERWVERSLEYYKLSHVVRYQLSMHSLSGLLSALSGRPTEAVEALAQAEEAALKRPYFTPYMLRFAGAIHAILGNWERADELLSTALATAEKGHFVVFIVEISTFYGQFLLAKGDIQRAEEVLINGIELAHEKGSVLQELKLLPLRCEVLVKTQRLELAEQTLKRARVLLTHNQPWGGLRAGVHLAEGLLAGARKNWLRAEKAFRSTRDTEQTYGFPYNEARVSFMWGQLYAKRNKAGDRERGRELLGNALDIYQRCDAKKDIEKVQTALASL